MDIITTKVVIAILFGLIRFVFGVLPIRKYYSLKKQAEAKGIYVSDETKRDALEFVISLVQSFGGGVLFATCFLRMMPEVYQALNEELQTNYPFSQILISVGFFAVYFVEEVVHWLIVRETRDSCGDDSKPRPISTKVSKKNKILPIITKLLHDSALEIEKNEKREKIKDVFVNEKQAILDSEKDNLSIRTVADSVDREVQTENVINSNLSCEVHPEFDEIVEKEVKTQLKILRCFIMVVSLSFDAILEGLVIGMQQTDTNIWYLFAGVSVHSATIVFCTSLEILLVGMQEKTTLIQLAMLSGTTPLGVLLGLVVSLTTETRANVKSLSIIVLQGLATGTILYVTFFEALNREKEKRTARAKRAICIASGFVLMALLESLKSYV